MQVFFFELINNPRTLTNLTFNKLEEKKSRLGLMLASVIETNIHIPVEDYVTSHLSLLTNKNHVKTAFNRVWIICLWALII